MNSDFFTNFVCFIFMNGIRVYYLINSIIFILLFLLAFIYLIHSFAFMTKKLIFGILSLISNCILTISAAVAFYLQNTVTPYKFVSVILIISPTLVIVLFYFAIQEWDAKFRSLEIKWKQFFLNITTIAVLLFNVIILICLLETFFEKTNLCMHTHFYLNSFSTSVQTLFVIGYGIFHCGMLFKQMNQKYEKFIFKSTKIIKIFTVVMIFFGIESLVSYITSFYCNLDKKRNFIIFKGICCMFPMAIMSICSLTFEMLMYKSLEYMNQTTVETELIE